MNISQLTTTDQKTRTPLSPKKNLDYVNKKFIFVSIKTVDGQIIVGNIYLRTHNITVKDELNGEKEKFVAVTDIVDGKGSTIPYTFLVNFSHIMYVVVQSEAPELQEYLNNSTSAAPLRQKKEVIIRMKDGKTLSGYIFIRNTIDRVKDELNSNEGKFIIMSEIKGAQNQTSSETYYVNKEHVIYFAVRNDPLQQDKTQ